MIHINLLPVREITQRLKLKRQILLSALVFLCFLGCLGLVAFYQIGERKGLEQAHQKLQQEKQQYTKILNEIKKLEEDKKVLETRIDVHPALVPEQPEMGGYQMMLSADILRGRYRDIAAPVVIAAVSA